jgi:8-oxo-dGTP pyrophosphatase MutT (NUDIX family)
MTEARARRETSAGGVVYRIVEGTPRFLLIRDSYKNWGFPKGHLKKGEAPDRAALREVAEETGLEELELHAPLGTISWTFRFRGRRIDKDCHFFLMGSPAGETAPQRAEGITACRWLAADEAMRKLSYENAREVLARALDAVRLASPSSL